MIGMKAFLWGSIKQAWIVKMFIKLHKSYTVKTEAHKYSYQHHISTLSTSLRTSETPDHFSLSEFQNYFSNQV